MEVRVPDIGDFTDVPVVEVLVAAGDEVEKESPLVTLESDKASMDVPSPAAGTVKQLAVKVGDRVSEGSVLLTLDTGEGEKDAADSEGGAGVTGSGMQPAGERPAEAPGRAPRPPQPAPVPAAAGAGPPAQKRKPSGPRPDADHSADLAVLGAGPGGYTAAFRAADLGLKVILIEREDKLGGVCLNVGCIPSKALLHMARVLAEVEEAAEAGIEFGKPKIDLDRLRSWKQSVVDKLTGGLDGLAKQRKVEVVRGTGRFEGDRLISVEGRNEGGGGKTTVAFDSAIIAAGSSAATIPGLPNDERVMDSTAALEIDEIPAKLLVIGGGIIGLEMATVYDALGSKVAVVEMLDSLIPGCDPDLVRPLRKRIDGRYEAILLGTKVAEVKAQKNGLKVAFEGSDAPKPALYDRILVAVGRRPNGAELQAEKAGVKVDDAGFIRVDEQLRTNVPHIHAIGDVVGEPMLAHKASHEGKAAAEAISGKNVAFDPRAIPSVAYTDPEVAWMGLTETEAKSKGTKFEKASFPWAASGRALSLGRSEGLTKLLFEPGTKRLLGAGMVGPNAGELIAETVHAIEMGSDAADIGLTIHPHPTLSESVGMAAEMAEGTITDLMPPKR
jgi:dihydrolipoamide dehydrogenase